MYTSSMTTVRTRFAPSPTGFLHVGGIRTALFAYLLAKQSNGQFVLRFEDTDKKREVAGSAAHLISSLKAIGLDYDEGPDIGGPYAPYVQSQRLEKYREVANRLIETGRAYADPYTPEQVQKFREEAQAQKRPFLYRRHRPDNPPAWDGTTPLRFRAEPKAYDWHDEVMGNIHTGQEVVDDFILIKGDGYPTYNFAHIVDDHDMHITHVMRGQEFLSSMPNYLNLYDALGFDRPIFAHLPHIMNEQGNKKLGKRDGAKDVLDYIRNGYLGEAMMSFIATMGWNDGTEQEIFTKNDLIARFSLDRVQRSGARFDEKRLLWVNGQIIRGLKLDELNDRATSFWPKSAELVPNDYKRQVLAVVQERLKTLADLPTLTHYFFEEPTPDRTLISGNKQLKKLRPNEIDHLVGAAYTKLGKVKQWDAPHIQEALNELLDETGQKAGILFSLIRLYTTWAPFSPELPATLELLGRDTTLHRLSQA